MVTILLQYVNKQIKEKIQGLQIFHRNSHIVQLYHMLATEKTVYRILDAVVIRDLFTQEGNVDFNTLVILD